MTCDEAKPLLDARLDDEIDPIRRAALDSHVDSCSSCATELDKLRNVRDAIRAEMPYYKAPLELRNQVRHALHGAEYLDKGAHRTSWRVWGGRRRLARILCPGGDAVFCKFAQPAATPG